MEDSIYRNFAQVSIGDGISDADRAAGDDPSFSHWRPDRHHRGEGATRAREGMLDRQRGGSRSRLRRLHRSGATDGTVLIGRTTPRPQLHVRRPLWTDAASMLPSDLKHSLSFGASGDCRLWLAPL